MLPSIIAKNQEKLNQLAQENDISYLALFGSYSRGEQTKESDLDLLVSFEKAPGLLKFVDIESQFSTVLGVKVDLITKRGLNKYVKPYIQDDIKVIYAKKS
jgi:uncharacterized protein